VEQGVQGLTGWRRNGRRTNPDSDGGGEGGHRGGWALAVPAVTLVTVFLVLPLMLMFRISMNRFVPGEFMVKALTLENYANVIAEPYYRETLVTTVSVAGITMLICLAAGLPTAYFLARIGAQRIKGLLIILVILPLLTGNAVRAAGWMVVLGDRGVVNSILIALGIRTEPLQIMYTPQAVIIGLTSVLLPFMIITLQSVMEGIDRSVEEASLSLGAPPLRTFFRVVVPLAMPGIFAGSLLCFILALNAYATPFLLGGPKFRMMAPVLYQQITVVNNWPVGATLAFLLMAVSLIIIFVSASILRSKQRA